MNYTHALVLCSVVISLVGAYAYIRDTLRGTTKPNRVTWVMWSIAPLIGTGAALSAGADPWTVVRVFLAGFVPLLVVFSSFVNKQSYWKLTTFDFLCGAASAVALVVWLVLNDPVMAVLLAALGDAFAAIPTLKKAWSAPETETVENYLASLVSVLLTIPSIQVWDIPNVAFPAYLFGINSLLILFILRPRIAGMFR